MPEQIPDVIIAESQQETQPLHDNRGVNYNNKAMNDLAGTIQTLPPLELGPISDAPIQPSWSRHEGSASGRGLSSQYSPRTEFLDGHEMVGSNGITELSPVGFSTQHRSVPARAIEKTIAPAPYQGSDELPLPLAGYILEGDTYWTTDKNNKRQQVDYARIKADRVDEVPGYNLHIDRQNRYWTFDNGTEKWMKVDPTSKEQYKMQN